MRTRVIRLDPENGPWEGLDDVARIVRDGGLVAFPTETVYGIAATAGDDDAVKRLFRTKKRDFGKPFTVHLADVSEFLRATRNPPLAARKLIRRFWPGPLTVVVGDRHGRLTGYRVPSLPLAREFLRLASSRGAAPISATSANLSGDEPARAAGQVLEHFDGLVDAIIDGGPCPLGAPSTVVRVDAEQDAPVRILREGFIPADEIRVATARLILFVCSGNRCRSPMAAAFASDLLARSLGCHQAELLERGFRVESAGTDCIHGTTATAEAQAAAMEYRCDLSAHRARPITPSLVEDADLIYVMTPAQRASILGFHLEAADRVRLLDTRGTAIADPYRQGAQAYRAAARQIHRAVEERLDDF